MEVRCSHVTLLPSVKFNSIPPHSLVKPGKVTPSSRKILVPGLTLWGRRLWGFEEL